jgi:predicted DNA-binding ribbon-helix-helix protein
MRATTIRFPNDLWDQLEREARKQGISVAQYVRDAALYRVAYSAGAREEKAGEAGARFPDRSDR